MYNRFKKQLSAFGLIILACLTPCLTKGQDLSFLSDTTHYLWPTDASPYISSTFGETRSSHFHAGLDIRTWGREGYQVFATRDGIVERIAIAPDGYGKVVFLRHNDDSYSIYAHLNRFENNLMAIADSIRMKDYRFLLDRNISGKKIQVRQGEVIGYTGSTGVGPPHLHFELRTPDNEPFNPLLTNLGVEDSVPPVFSNAAVEHLDPNTFQVTRTETARAEPIGNEFDLGTFRADGPVGISVDVHDRANRTPNIYAVYSLTLVHQQDTLFHSGVDAFNYRDATQLFIDRVFPLLREQRRGYQRLYVVNGNELSFYETDKRRGVVDLPEGDHELKIIASDYYGNRTTAFLNLEIRGRTSPVSDQISAVPAYPNYSNEFTDTKKTIFAGVNQNQLNPARFNDHRLTAGPAEETSSSRSVIHFNSDYQGQSVRKKLNPGVQQILHLPDQTLWIRFPENALFDTLDAGISISMENNLPVIRFDPNWIPLKSKAFISILLHERRNSNQPIGLYTYNRRSNRYTLVGSGTNGAILHAPITELRDLYVKTDSTSPWVGQPTLTENLGGKAVVYVPVVDEQSGIDFLNSSIEVNGEKGIVEYDPDQNRLKFYNPEFVPDDQNRVEVRVSDRLGNSTHRIFNNIRWSPNR